MLPTAATPTTAASTRRACSTRRDSRDRRIRRRVRGRSPGPSAPAAGIRRHVDRGRRVHRARRDRFCVLLVALRPTVVLAKELATLAAFAPGRLRIGVGVGGEYPPEFAIAGVPLAQRGDRTETAVEQLRSLLAGRPTTVVGVDGVEIEVTIAPAAPGEVPVLFAGWNEVALRRAARLGDGWIGYLLAPDSFRVGVPCCSSAAPSSGCRRCSPPGCCCRCRPTTTCRGAGDAPPGTRGRESSRTMSRFPTTCSSGTSGGDRRPTPQLLGAGVHRHGAEPGRPGSRFPRAGRGARGRGAPASPCVRVGHRDREQVIV